MNGLESINYHVSCFADLNYKYSHKKSPTKKRLSNQQSEWANRRNIHSIAFEKLELWLKKTLIEGNGVQALSDIHEMYVALFDEHKIQKEPHSSEIEFKAHHLFRKISEKIPSLTKSLYKNRTYVHKKDLSIDEIYAQVFQKKDDWNKQIRSVAFFIRKKVLSMEQRTLVKRNLTFEDIVNGECDIPEELILLIGSLLKGPNSSKSLSKEKRIISICSSIIFALSNGLIKPSVTVQLGLATKSLTGSRKMLNILNRLGYSISYTTVEELETEIAFGCSAKQQVVPFGLKTHSPHLNTHVAFDNFDKFVETASGKNTLHDTVGIVYQNIEEHVPVSHEETIGRQHGDKRRRKYESSFDSSVVPYIRGNQRSQSLVGEPPTVPHNLQNAAHLDHLYMFHHALNATAGQRWFSFNSERVEDQNPVHKIGYLPNINFSPTSDSVVKKTLEVAQSVAIECDQQYIICTYDLAIAAKAYRIQLDLSPQFDNVFITLGAFHTELSFFKASDIFVNNFFLKYRNNNN